MSYQAYPVFEEFYITSNPPLLPHAVDKIVSLARQELPEDVLMEILYEAEIPWFKCIADHNSRPQVEDFIQELLSDTIESETNLIDPDDLHIESEMRNNMGKLVDIEIITDNPHVVPWITYADANLTSLEEYDSSRYPEMMTSSPFKAVWRGIEQWPKATASHLLETAHLLCGNTYVPVAQDQIGEAIGKLIDCNVLYNLEMNVLYISSEKSASTLTSAIKRLDNLIRAVDRDFSSNNHIIATTVPESELRLAYRWLSHLGLARRTFAVDTAISKDEYANILSAAALRAAIKNEDGEWMLDQTTYSTDATFDPAETFQAFDDLVYTNKRRSQNNRTIPSRPASARSIGVTRGASPKPVQMKPPENKFNFGWTNSALSSKTDSQKRREIENQIAVEKHTIDPQDNSPKVQLSRDSGAGPLHLVPTLSWGSVNTKNVGNWTKVCTVSSWAPTLDRNTVSKKMANVDAWMEHMAANTRRAPTAVQACVAGVTDSQEDLLAFDEPHVIRPKTPSRLVNLVEMPSLVPSTCSHGDLIHMETPEALINFESQPSTPRPSTNQTDRDWLGLGSPSKHHSQLYMLSSPLKQALRSSPPEKTVLSEKYPSDLMDWGETNLPEWKDSADSKRIPQFGLQNEASKGFRQTMNQRAGPSFKRGLTNRAANVAKKTETRLLETFGSRVLKSPWSEVGKGGPDPKASEPSQPHVPPPRLERTEPLESPKAGEQSAWPIQMPRAPQPHNHSVPPASSNTQYSNIERTLKNLKSPVRSMARMLEMVAGEVKLELKFGRLYFKNPGEANVNIGCGPLWELERVRDSLTDGSIAASTIGFSSILSSMGADANRLARIKIPRDPGWNPTETKVTYNFTCRLVKENISTRFMVKIDAESFDYQCQGLDDEIASTHVHWPQHAWDMKVCATRARVALPKECEQYAKTMVGSLDVFAGEVTIRATEDEGNGVSIDSVCIRHLASYRSKEENGRQLTIAMTRPVGKSFHFHGPTKFTGTTMFARTKQDLCGNLGEYFEASLCSWRAAELFKQNLGLKFGDKTAWNCEQLEQEQVFDDICWPALGMISQMDGIGSANNNEQGPSLSGAKASSYGPGANPKKYEFW